MMRVEDVFRNYDRDLANKILDFIRDKTNTWEDIHRELSPSNPMFDSNGYLTDYWRWVFVNLKILSVSGKHFVKPFNIKN